MQWLLKMLNYYVSSSQILLLVWFLCSSAVANTMCSGTEKDVELLCTVISDTSTGVISCLNCCCKYSIQYIYFHVHVVYP